MALSLFYWVVCAFSFFVKYVTGFGNTLIMTPLYAFSLSSAFITPVDLLLNLPANVSVVYGNRQSIQKDRVLPILGFVVLGAVPGALFLKFTDPALMKSLLGLLVTALGLQMLFNLHGKKPASSKTSPVILFLCGIILGAYGVGAVLAGYLGKKLPDPNEFRGTICVVFLLENITRVGTYLAAGLLTPQVLLFDLFLLPAVLAGLLIGRLTLRCLSQNVLRRGVQVLLVASGLSLFLNNVTALLPA